MAPILQCPDCGARHPLDVASEVGSFRCAGCGRVLKVPAQFRAAPSAEPMRPTPAPNPNGRATPSNRTRRALSGAVPAAWRLAAWLVALPLGFVIVFSFAQATNILSRSQLEDVIFESGWDRFWPLARLLPFVALVTAALVHFSVLAMSQLRVRHATRRVAPPRQDRTELREPVRPAS